MRQSNYKIRLTRLQQITEELKPLCKDVEKLQNKIRALCIEREKLTDEQSEYTIKSLPKDYKKFNPEQWLWVLSKGHDIRGMVHHNFQCAVLNKMGFSSSGFYPETNQTALNLHAPFMFGTTTPLNSNLLKESFKILKKYLKPVTVEDSHHGTEIGIRIDLHGLEEDTASTLYVHKGGDAVLYRTRWSDPVPFKSFDAFADWFHEQEAGE